EDLCSVGRPRRRSDQAGEIEFFQIEALHDGSPPARQLVGISDKAGRLPRAQDRSHQAQNQKSKKCAHKFSQIGRVSRKPDWNYCVIKSAVAIVISPFAKEIGIRSEHLRYIIARFAPTRSSRAIWPAYQLNG